MKIKIYAGRSVFYGLTPGKLYRVVQTGIVAIDQLPVYLCDTGISSECITLPPGTLLVFLHKEEMIDCGAQEEDSNDIPPNVFLFEDLKISMGAYLGNIGWALEEVDTGDV